MNDLPSQEEYDAFDAHLDKLMRDAAHQDEWERFDILMREAAYAPHPYLVHAYVLGCLSDRMTEDLAASNMYLLWAWLGDWYELRDDIEAIEAESYMQEAAQEWLELPDDSDSRAAYINRLDAKLIARGISDGLNAPVSPEWADPLAAARRGIQVRGQTDPKGNRTGTS